MTNDILNIKREIRRWKKFCHQGRDQKFLSNSFFSQFYFQIKCFLKSKKVIKRHHRSSNWKRVREHWENYMETSSVHDKQNRKAYKRKKFSSLTNSPRDLWMCRKEKEKTKNQLRNIFAFVRWTLIKSFISSIKTHSVITSDTE